MANTVTWTSTVPGGVMKSHAIGDPLIKAATENSVFFEHANLVTNFGLHQGETVTFERLSRPAEKSSYVIGETDRVPIREIVITTVSGTVEEIGQGIRYTDFARQLNKFDLQEPIQQDLRDELTLALDTIIASGFRTGQHKYSVTGQASGQLQAGGTFTVTSKSNLKVWHLEEIYDTLWDTLNAKPASGKDYVGIFRHKSLRGIHRDPDFREPYQYINAEKLMNFEVGRVSNIRLIDTNHVKALGIVGTGSVLGEGVVFGADALKLAEIVRPELVLGRDDDFGRKESVAFLGKLKAFLTWGDSNKAGEANTIFVGCA